MRARLTLVALILLSQTGCVAAVPMLAQLVAQPDMAKQLCSFAKMPGQTNSFCDRNSPAPVAQAPAKVPNGGRVDTASR